MIQHFWLQCKIQTTWRLHYLLAAFKQQFHAGNPSVVHHRMFERPLVYSCSGCSSAAQMANYIAVQLHRQGLAEMSCIAGVGGSVKKMLQMAGSGRRIIAIDGCSLKCSKACLRMHALEPDGYFELSRMGVKKLDREDFDMEEARNILSQIQAQTGILANSNDAFLKMI